MSGGAYNYAYVNVREMGEELIHSGGDERVAFGRLMLKVAEAMHDIEWVDSGDYSHGDESEAIKVALGESASQLILDESIESAKNAIEKLTEAIAEAKSG